MPESTWHPAYPEIKARFPGVKLDGGGMTSAQGRVVFHQERIFRSTGGGLRAHDTYIALAQAHGLPACIGEWSADQCALALRLIEQAARIHRLHLFRRISCV